MDEIKKPIKRGPVRQYFGKEYFILKRKFLWFVNSINYAKDINLIGYDNLVFTHRSLILRPLKDVEMYLQENKRENLRLAIQHLNNIEIKPGEVFSLWKLVGRPTARKGYLEGLVLKNGKTEKDIGGGLCQLGNLLFWIFAHSPLKVIERYRHGYDVFPDVKRKVPFGAGATLSYNYIDLQIKNTTSNSFCLKLWIDETHLNGKLTAQVELSESYKVVERNHIIKQQFWGGYSRHNQIFKIIEHKGVVKEELLVENNAIMMYNPILNNPKSPEE